MKKIAITALTFTVAGVLLLHTPNVSAQDAPPSPGAAGDTTGQSGADRMAQFRARMEERVKTSLKASDDEWAVIQPLLDKVESKQREALMSRYSGMMGGYRGSSDRRSTDSNGGGGDRSDRSSRYGGSRSSSPEAQALNDALQNDNASVDEIKTKLAALREQRKKSAAELTQAREDLKKVLNMRQEATLVAMGILD